MNQILPMQYSVIYADPPWKFDNFSTKGEKKNPNQHYPCMSLAELKAMRDDVLFATGPDAVCIMWATSPILPQALELMAHWGFQYKAIGPWEKITKHGKQAFGTGYIYRSAAEFFLLGTVGNPRIKSKSVRNALFTGSIPDDLRDLGISVFGGLREHSRKPDEMIPMIEDLFEGPYLELFARTRRPGWDAYGNQIDKFTEAA